MSLSNDEEEEEEFQSADEDGFDDELQAHDSESRTTKLAERTDSLGEQQIESISKTSSVPHIESEVKQSLAPKQERIPSASDTDKQESKHTSNDEEEDDDDDDDDENEEALAERIRERNLKIARKFSAELAKSVKASAPIPVKAESPIGFRVDDIEYPDIPDSETKARQPLAPPPTPALSSSFSADEPSASTSTQDSPGTQYGWRVPIKPPPKPTDTPAKDCDLNQARAALDKMSEKYSDADKSLFQMVADDLKKVSIKSEDPPTTTHQESASPGSTALSSLSSLGQTFGGWNWNSASRILASASEVTSQVTSVLDSVVNAPRVAPTQEDPSERVHEVANQTSPSPNPIQPSARASSMSASDAMSNDALVDLTLNAMESLGKKAFGAMTHRDESGSLQIKGLGRPWEQLLNTKKVQSEQLEDETQESGPIAQTSTLVEPSRIKDSDIPDRTTTVRRRVVKYDDSDTLD